MRATITEVEGGPPIAVGAGCMFPVERRDGPDGTYRCSAQIVCGGQLVYGGSDLGFFACTLLDPPRRDVIGADGRTHEEDGDAALSLDTVQGELEIWDDGTGPLGEFRIAAAIDSVE